MQDTVVFLPGLLCDVAVWQPQCEALSGPIQCVVPDYEYRDSITLMAKHVLSTVQAERFALAGHSMGGRVALEVVRLAPERVTRLALLDTGYQARPDDEVGERERAARLHLLSVAREKGMREMGRNWAPGMVHPSHVNSSVFDAILNMIARSDPAKFEAQITALLQRPEATQLLPTISCPTMIVCGRQDEWSPLSRHELMHSAIPHSRLRVVEDSGHMTTMEQPAAVIAILDEWLTLPATPSKGDLAA